MLDRLTSSIQARSQWARSKLHTGWDLARTRWVAVRDRARPVLVPAVPWLWFTLFALCASWAYSDPNQTRSAAAVVEAHGDGFYYYSYLRSLVWDHDVDFTNDYELLPDQFHAGINPITKRPQNVFTVGPALFWAPLVPVAKVAQRIAENFGAPHEPQLNGAEYDFQRVVLYGSVLAGLVAVAIGMLISLGFAQPTLSAFGAIGVCLASPLIWFMLRQPSYSHAIDACAAALFVGFWFVRYGSRKLWHWSMLGVLLGVAMLVRPQNVAHGLLPFVEWCIGAWVLLRRGPRSALPRWFGNAFALLFATAIAFTPLLLAWKAIYGEWTLVPQGSTFMYWTNSRWEAVLFTSRSGLFGWHPLLLLGLAGLCVLPLWRSQPTKLRLLAVLGIVVLFAQAYINGAAHDYWGGWAYGGRRFMSCSVYLMPGLACMLELGRRFTQRHPTRVAQLCAFGLIGAFALYNRSIADDYTNFKLFLDQPQHMKPRFGAAMQKALDDFYPYTGNPGSWPLSLFYAWRTGGSPATYDLAGAADIFAGPFAQPVPLDDAHAAAGFEPESSYQGRPARLVKGRAASWVFATRVAVDATGTARLVASRPGIRVRMRVGRNWFFDRRVTAEWDEYHFKLPPEATSAGVVVVNVEQSLRRPDDFVAWDALSLTLVDRRPPEEQRKF
jgi:hypothetical protein